jgi:C4-dicarboxylate transporter DctM subunit
MSPITVGFVGIGVLLLLLAAGMPIGFVMVLVGFTGSALLAGTGAAWHIIGTIPYELISDYNYSVLPLFLLMASICLHAGLGESLYNLVYTWLGRLPGGLAIATIGACAFFAAACASSIATALTIGLVALPEMKKYNYRPSLAAGCIAAGGTLGILIPPSGILIVYGILTEQSIGTLFIAGIVPGIVLAVMFMIMILIRSKITPSLGPPGPSTTFKEKATAIRGCWDMLVLISLVIGGLIIGWFTPTEAGAVGAFGAIVLSLIRRKLTRRGFIDSVVETIRGTGMVFLILIGALIYNVFLAVSTIPMELSNIVGSLNLPPVAILVVIIMIYFFLGCFIDAMAMVLLTIPVFYPLAVKLGFDPIWFGILIVIVVEMAMITPPIGMNVFVISGVARDVPMSIIFKGIFPFVYIMAVFMGLLIAFPQIALFLPKLTR